MTHDVEPGDPWCDVVQHAAANGDVVRLAPGDYEGDCLVMKSGIPDEGEPLAIIGRGDGPVRILGRPGAPVLTIVGNYVRLGHLHLIAASDSPVVLVRGRSLLIDDCILEGGTVGLDLTSATGGLSAIGNRFEDVAAPIRAPCPPESCDRSRFVLRDNVFRSASTHPGAAVEVATDVEIEAENNTVEGAWDVGFKLACRNGGIRVQQNAILGGGTGVEVAVGTSGADIFNNIIIETTIAAIGLHGTAERVRIVGNTLVPGAGDVMRGPEPALRAGNAVLGPANSDADVGCTDTNACWLAPDALDFRPRPDGPLLRDLAGPPASATMRDFCSSNRRDANAAGAVAGSTTHALRLQPVRKSVSGCFQADFVDPELASRRSPVTDTTSDDPHGCNQGQHTLPWFAASLWLLVKRLFQGAGPWRRRHT